MNKAERTVLGSPILAKGNFSDIIQVFNIGIDEEESSDGNETFVIKRDCDSGSETDLEDAETLTGSNFAHDVTGEKAYIKTCKLLKIIPSSHIVRSLNSQVLNARHRSIGPKEAQSIADALMSNMFVKTVDLEGNNIGHDGLSKLFKMLLENCFISELSLSENNIGSKGAAVLANILRHTRSLASVNLKGNRLSDNDSALLSEGIATNDTIKTLNLSHNEFRSQAGHKLGSAIVNNATIVSLDLSWNHLRMEGAIAFARSLAKNRSIQVLNLRYNGFADNGAAAMGEALAHNHCLKSLDLSHNRISDKGAVALSRGLAKNKALQCLDIGYNPISRDGGLSLLSAAKEAKELVELLMEEIYLDEEAFEVLEELVRSRSTLKVRYQGLARESGLGSNKNEILMLKKKIFDRIRKFLKEKRLRMIDLFNTWDKDKSMTLSMEEFEAGIRNSSIPLSNDMIAFLVSQLDNDKDGLVAYNEFTKISGIE